mmetsp:Transcript_17656/g.38090  ORF Transcript_17656/g.38090 Transcript_17656/m.38090 type:complete len:247 (-) Transcript_17656:110-850(-)
MPATLQRACVSNPPSRTEWGGGCRSEAARRLCRALVPFCIVLVAQLFEGFVGILRHLSDGFVVEGLGRAADSGCVALLGVAVRRIACARGGCANANAEAGAWGTKGGGGGWGTKRRGGRSAEGGDAATEGAAAAKGARRRGCRAKRCGRGCAERRCRRLLRNRVRGCTPKRRGRCRPKHRFRRAKREGRRSSRPKGRSSPERRGGGGGGRAKQPATKCGRGCGCTKGCCRRGGTKRRRCRCAPVKE